ncbi:plastocyanin-like domain protein [Ceratobasidium sp. AG-Ba]|nr:plastocyanin-like domain protein [Ceratobasidium sp. AG-Ba]
MYFNIASIVSVVVLALPLAASAAPAVELDLEARGPKTHKVTVGKNGKLRYKPEYVRAKVGDYIKFEFHPKNHTVTESSFDDPCYKLEDNEGNQVGFATGFVPVPEDQTSHFPTRKYKVTDDHPHWFYCGQVGHCPAGMVFAVNPPKKGDKTFKKFKEAAMNSVQN